MLPTQTKAVDIFCPVHMVSVLNKNVLCSECSRILLAACEVQNQGENNNTPQSENVRVKGVALGQRGAGSY